jgi:sugar phosphate isomerase/epimerase
MAPSSPVKGGLLGKGTVFEAIDAAKAISCDALEVFLMWKKLSAKGLQADYFGEPYPYWDPSKTAVRLNEQKRDARLGLCLDTGHVARSGLDVTAVTKACAGRIISAHLKDVARLKLHDVRYGTDVASVLAEMRSQKIAGHIALEYESFNSPTFDEDIRLQMDFIRTNTQHLKH